MSGFVGTERFAVLGELGAGGMGVVYRAFDRDLEREVALKTARRPDPGDVYRLKQEFRSRAGISHPNLLQLHDLVVEDDRCFFTMELVDAVDFLSWARADEDDEALVPTLTIAKRESPDDDVDGSGDRFVRPPLDLAGQRRLRAGLRQLLGALGVLHRAGIVHRDVKPGNVLVSRQDQRVVLADFGLATPRPELADHDSFEGFPVGSVPYMAPEQAAGQAVGPEADLYAVGVMVYEALGGRPPFRGPALRVLHQKATRDPAPLTSLAEGMPEDLSTLADDLLSRDPERRPSVEEALVRLEPGDGWEDGPDESLSATATLGLGIIAADPGAPFVGRVAELAVLDRAWARAQTGAWTTVHVQGASGIGKSMLLRRFTRQVQVAGGALVLRGRCHPQESLPFKALDAVIDSLSHHLARLTEAEQRSLAPRYGRALRRLFPVLGRVDGLRYAEGDKPAADPREVRRQGFSGLRDLLARVADRQPVLIWIDDLQWGDLDSAVLLRELVRPPDSPAVLLLLSYRREDLEAPLVQELRCLIPELAVPSELPPGSGDFRPVRDAGAVTELALAPLDQDERRDLASRLLDATSPAYRRHLPALVAESRGNPFFLCEMARYLAETAEDSAEWRADSLALADVVSPRIEALPGDARRLLEVVSVTGRPVSRSLALRAAGLEPVGRSLVSQMIEEYLLRPTSPGDCIAPYHDRIREATIDLLPGPRLERLHRRIAEVLEAEQPDELEALVGHWMGAGERERAGGYALRAADRASSTLAFGRAAEMYRRALTLLPNVGQRWELEAARAEALANAGRGEEAGTAFLAAAEALCAEDAEAPRALWWRGRAAEHYVKSSALAEGWAVMRDVLGRTGVSVPNSPAACTKAAALLRSRLLIRGFRFTPRDAEEVDPAVLARLDVLWRVATSLAMVNHTLSDVLAVRHLLEALKVGERTRVAHALANEAAFESILRGAWLRRRVDKLMGVAREVWEDSEDPYDHALLAMTLGIIALFDGDFRAVVDRCDEAEAALREQCLGAHWEIGICHNFALSALAMLGEMGELRRRSRAVIRDAELRGDRFAENATRMGEPSMAWLAEDDPGEAHRQLALAESELRSGQSRWPESSFRTQHYHRLIAFINLALYEGRAEDAWTEVEAAWPKLRKAGFIRLRFTGPELRQLRGRAALAAAATRPEAAAIAGAEARRLRRDAQPMARPMGELLAAGLEATAGRDARIDALLKGAAAGFDRAGLGLYREAARWRLAERGGGSHSRAEAATWMTDHGVVAPARMVGLLAPGF